MSKRIINIETENTTNFFKTNAPTIIVNKAIVKANKIISKTNEYNYFFDDIKAYITKKGFKIKRIEIEDFNGDMCYIC